MLQRPNILIIYTDQQRWDAMQVNGNADIQTPNLDRLASEGVNFDHYFIQNPVCMPSRASFLTGQYPGTLGITHMGVPVPEDTVTFPRMLRNFGYRSANIGKLHFLPHANRNHSDIHPDYGFDHLEISDEPGPYEDAFRSYVRRIAPDQLDFISAGLPPMAEIWNRYLGIKNTVKHPEERFPKRPIPFPGRDDVTHTAFVANQTIQFINQHAEGADPFMCIAGIYSPHSPWLAPQRFLDLYDPKSLSLPSFPPEVDAQRKAGHYDDEELGLARQGYYGMVSEVDHHVGQILQSLEDNGIADNTIVVFTSDHGEWLGEHLRYGKSYPGHDVVSRVPLLIRMPGGETGKRVEHITEGVDVIPTLLEASGIPLPPHLQGQSLFPLLTDSDDPVKESALMEATGWKMIRTQDHRYAVHDDGREFLYDLNAQWGEYHDVSGDSKYNSALSDMRHHLLQRLVAQERPLQRIWPY